MVLTTLYLVLMWKNSDQTTSHFILLFFSSSNTYNQSLLTQYKKALEKAVKISTIHNVAPISGSTVVICSMDLSAMEKSSLKSRRTVSLEIINVVRTQSFPKNYFFLPPDTHTNVFVSGGKKC